jgi:hypothetical protein
VFKAAAGKENAVKYQTVGFALSSACAEFIADIALAPFEAVSFVAKKQLINSSLIGQN